MATQNVEAKPGSEQHFRTESHWVPLESVEIGGHRVVCASRRQLTEAMIADCRSANRSGRKTPPRLVFDVNGHGISMAASDEGYRRSVSAADVIHADGGFIVSLSRILCETRILERSATTDLFHDFAKACEENQLSFYLLGGTEEVNSQCFDKLRVLYPDLKLVGRRNGYFTDAEEKFVVEDINSKAPDILWIGLGKPKEQAFAVKWRSELNAGWAITCGGCYNYVTGHYPRAPQWMQNFNIEWLHRAASNPKQLLWRYLTTSPHAVWVIAKSSIFRNRSLR